MDGILVSIWMGVHDSRGILVSVGVDDSPRTGAFYDSLLTKMEIAIGLHRVGI